MSLRRLPSLLPTFVAALLGAMIVLGGIPPSIVPPAAAGDQKGENKRDVIVLLKRGTDPRAIARGAGARPTHVYEHVIDGFAAQLPPQAIRGLENHPLVVAVVPDRPVGAFTTTFPGVGRIAAEAAHAPHKCRKIEAKQKRQRCIKKAKNHGSPSSPPDEIVAPSPSVSVAPPVEQPIQATPTGVNRVDADVSSLGSPGGCRYE